MLKWITIFCLSCTFGLEAEFKILAFSGSTRSGSYNQALVAEAARMAGQMGANVTLINLKDYPLPFYDADLEVSRGMPSNAKELRRMLKNSDAIFIASPEYNQSVSAILKNALDWSSRREEGGFTRDAFQSKKIVLMSTSPSSRTGQKGLEHLKDIIQELGGSVVAAPLNIPRAREAFDERGNLKNKDQRQKLHQLVSKTLK